MDIADTIAPNSEQVNAEDFLAGPRTVTITAVEKGTADQPVFIHLAEFEGRTYRPAKSMRRLLIVCWGAEASAYVGRRLELYQDPTVRWGGKEVGGIRISRLSHISGPQTVNLTVSRGKRAPFTVQPLEQPKDESGRDWLKELAETDGDADLIGALGVAAKNAHASPTVLTVIREAYQTAKDGDR